MIHIGDDISRAGIDLNEVTDDAEVRRLLAEFDGERYGEQGTDSGTVPETEEAGAGYEGLDAETLYQFIGEKGAAALDRAEEASARMDNLGVAREMESAGKEAKAIKLATGWERGADGKWRYEVDDSLAFIDGRAGWKQAKLYRADGGQGLPLKSFLAATEVFDAYPQLGDVKVRFNDSMERGGIRAEGRTDGRTFIEVRPDLPELKMRSVLLHEIQYMIQTVEGFAPGGNAGMFADPLFDAKVKWMELLTDWREEGRTPEDAVNHYKNDIEADKEGEFYSPVERQAFREIADSGDVWGEVDRIFDEALSRPTPHEQYRRLAGEVESRNTERRMFMSFAERRASLASETEDVARKDQIFLKDGVEGGMAAEQEARENIATAEEKLRRDAEAFGREVDKVFANDRVPSSNIRMLSQTPLVMQMVASDATSVKAAAKGGVWVSPHTFSNALSALGHPGMTADVLKQIPEALANPIAIFDSDSQQNRKAGDLVFMVGVQDTNGATVVLPVALNVRGGLVNINIIKSAYGKESNGIPNNQWFISQANRNARYVNGQMFGDWLRHNGLSRSAGVQFPFVRTTNSNGHSVYNEADLAKLKGENTTLYQSVPAASDRLMAVHNLSGDNLVFADEMGGLAVPSSVGL